MLWLGCPALKYARMAGRAPSHPRMATPHTRWSSSTTTTTLDARDPEVRTVEYDAVKRWTAAPTTGIHVIDVRETHEVAEHGLIPFAKNIPLSVLKDVLHLEPETFKAKVGHEKPPVHHELVFYCRSGKRAGVAALAALQNGYKNVVNYKGSWQDWAEREKGRTACSA